MTGLLVQIGKRSDTATTTIRQPRVQRLLTDVPDRRGKPVLESECLAPIPSEIPVLTELEETEVDPCDEEPELDEDVR